MPLKLGPIGLAPGVPPASGDHAEGVSFEQPGQPRRDIVVAPRRDRSTWSRLTAFSFGAGHDSPHHHPDTCPRGHRSGSPRWTASPQAAQPASSAQPWKCWPAGPRCAVVMCPFGKEEDMCGTALTHTSQPHRHKARRTGHGPSRARYRRSTTAGQLVPRGLGDGRRAGGPCRSIRRRCDRP